MKLRSIVTIIPSTLLRASLLAVVLLVSCAPASASVPAEPQAPPQPTEPVVEASPAPPPTEAQAPVLPTEVPPTEAPPTEVPQPVATSRGDSLHATNPTNVSLASGELQLVEFFRFT